MREWIRRRLDVVTLAILAYIPVLTAASGRGVADTKLYLFTDPARLLAEARYTWDPAQFAGWVPHQTALYLWPSGPWFWLGESLGLPDWLTHRLWVGTILFAAGMGVRFAAKVLGLSPLGAFVAALSYQLSPYVLPYVSRTSVMLLPWAGLGWIVGHTVLAARHGRWRNAIAVALVVLTVGATNATATLMIAPAPVLWLLWSALRSDITWRRATITAARLGVLSLLVSSWWMVKLVVQGRFGAPVLSYSETLEAVSATSTAPEIARGLGYWLFYVSDPYIATTTAAAPHLVSTTVILANFAVVVVGLLGLVATRWAPRGYAALLALVGTLLGVGAHLVSDPSLLQRILFDDTRSGVALAIRSSSRAVPLVSFALVLGVGALVTAVATHDARRSRRRRLGAMAAVAMCAVTVVGLPAVREGGYVDPALERDDRFPTAWIEAAAHLDADADGGRVLQMPGQESAAFRWGYTVDPPLPGLSDRPLVTRDWLPAGSAGVMDLLYAFDDRVQSGVLEAASVAPVARWLGADTVWLAGDIAYDRFDTARPEPVAALLSKAPGLGEPMGFGAPVANVPAVPMLDEQSLGDPDVGTALAPVSLIPIVDPAPAVRASRDVVVLAGDGEGLVDAAGAGVLRGDELVRYAADIPDPDLAAALTDARLVVITDTNRDRAHHWRGSQDVVGFTEDGTGLGVLVDDPADERLDVFPRQTLEDRTVAVQHGPVQAYASRYGEALRYRPEDRAAMAIDGDVATAWTVADRGEPVGEFIELRARAAVDTVRVVQPIDPDLNRWITAVEIVVDPGSDDEQSVVVELSARSRTAEGEVVTLPRASDHIRLVVSATDTRAREELTGVDGVGFAEIDLGLGTTEERVIPPRVPVPSGTGAIVLLTRHRVAATDRWRSDPEPRLVRALPADLGDLDLVDVTVRLDRRASDAELAELLDARHLPTASSRLLGQPNVAGWAALDDDLDTAWITAFAEADDIVLTLPDPEPGQELTITQRDIERHSRVTRVRLARGDEVVTLDVPSPDATGRSRMALPRRLAAAKGQLRLVIDGIEPRTTVDRRTFDVVQLPVGITEIAGLTDPTSVPSSFRTDCRDDLLEIDGRGVPLRISGDTHTALAGEPLVVEVCERVSTSGDRVLRSGRVPGLVVDRVVFRSPGLVTGDVSADAIVTEVDSTRTSRTFEVSECDDGCWFSMGEGLNDGWTARIDGDDLGDPVMLSGGMGGWWVPPGDGARLIAIEWSGQGVVDLAIVLSALSALALTACLAVLRRRDAVTHVPVCAPTGRRPFVRARRRDVAVIGAIAAVVTSLGVSVAAGAVLALVVAVSVVARQDAVMSFTGLALVAVTPLIIVWRQRSERSPADFGWISHYDDLHRPFFVGLILVVTAVVTSALREDTR